MTDPLAPGFADRLAEAGAEPAEVQDRRVEPKSGYDAMQKNLNYVGAAVRHEYPVLREFDLKLPQPKQHHRPPAGELSKQAGYNDIPSDFQGWWDRLKSDLYYTFFTMEGIK